MVCHDPLRRGGGLLSSVDWIFRPSWCRVWSPAPLAACLSTTPCHLGAPHSPGLAEAPCSSPRPAIGSPVTLYCILSNLFAALGSLHCAFHQANLIPSPRFAANTEARRPLILHTSSCLFFPLAFLQPCTLAAAACNMHEPSKGLWARICAGSRCYTGCNVNMHMAPTAMHTA